MGWVVAAVLVLVFSMSVGTWAGLVGYGSTAQPLEEASCLADTVCGPHGAVRVFSSPAERDQQLGRPSMDDSAGSADRWRTTRSASVCACVCDEGWSGEDCTTAPLGMLETVWWELSGTFSTMHSRLHEQLAL